MCTWPENDLCHVYWFVNDPNVIAKCFSRNYKWLILVEEVITWNSLPPPPSSLSIASLPLSHSYSLSPSLFHTYSLTHTLSLSLSCALISTHTYTLSLSAHTHTHMHAPILEALTHPVCRHNAYQSGHSSAFQLIRTTEMLSLELTNVYATLNWWHSLESWQHSFQQSTLNYLNTC